MNPVELLTSESQERMLAIVTPENLDEVLALCERWEIRATVVGRVTDSAPLPRLRRATSTRSACPARTRCRRSATTRPRCPRTATPVADVPIGSLGDGPLYHRPLAPPADLAARQAADPGPGRCSSAFPPGTDLSTELLDLLASPNIADKSWVWRQYDHQLFLNTVAGPGGDASVLRLKETAARALALSVDGKGRFCALDPRIGRAARGARGGPQRRVQRRPSAGARELPELREPRAPRGDVAVLRGGRRHGRRVPRARHPGRRRQRELLQRVARRGHRPDAGRRRDRADRPARRRRRPASRCAPATGSCMLGDDPDRARRLGVGDAATACATGARRGPISRRPGSCTISSPGSSTDRMVGGHPRLLRRRGRGRARRDGDRRRVGFRVADRRRADVLLGVHVARRALGGARSARRGARPRRIRRCPGGRPRRRRRRPTSTPTARFDVPLAAADQRLARRHSFDHGRRCRRGIMAACSPAHDPSDPSSAKRPPATPVASSACTAPGQPVSQLTYLGLFALQHRGQESAGIAVSDGETITVAKDMGLVTQVFDERRLAPLQGHLAIGHNRYSTTGSSSWQNAQPVYRSVGDAGFALGHNGNLTNTAELASGLGMLPGMTPDETSFDSTTDSALIAELVAREWPDEPRSDGRELELALEKVLPDLRGRLLVRAHGRRAAHRRPRPARLLAAGARPARRRRLGARERDGRARHRRCALRARRAAGRDGRHRRVRAAPGAPLRGARPAAVPLRVHLLRPPRHAPLRPQRARGAPAHGRVARPAGTGRPPTW